MLPENQTVRMFSGPESRKRSRSTKISVGGFSAMPRMSRTIVRMPAMVRQATCAV